MGKKMIEAPEASLRGHLGMSDDDVAQGHSKYHDAEMKKSVEALGRLFKNPKQALKEHKIEIEVESNEDEEE